MLSSISCESSLVTSQAVSFTVRKLKQVKRLLCASCLLQHKHVSKFTSKYWHRYRPLFLLFPEGPSQLFFTASSSAGHSKAVTVLMCFLLLLLSLILGICFSLTGNLIYICILMAFSTAFLGRVLGANELFCTMVCSLAGVYHLLQLLSEKKSHIAFMKSFLSISREAFKWQDG